MRINRPIVKIKRPLAFLLTSFVSITACIEEFNPDIDESGKYLVISGSVIKGVSLQVVRISYTKPFGSNYLTMKKLI